MSEIMKFWKKKQPIKSSHVIQDITTDSRRFLRNWTSMNNSAIQARWPWSYVDKSSHCFATICGRHLQEWSSWHCLTLAVGRRESDSNVTNAVIPRVYLLPPHHWITAVPTASAGPLCLAWQLPCCGMGRKLDSKLPKVLNSARRTTPEDATHRWWWNVNFC